MIIVPGKKLIMIKRKDLFLKITSSGAAVENSSMILLPFILKKVIPPDASRADSRPL
jgi:hypothetical protein